ncbi:uncharacterized protein ARMOST_12531 [Armillaria ostoyae]|uniref:Uncharacterized protein n=1 Tax=Armillaria ostoyae TaxID=47428 RepID=A0A284RK91_ARMOS|nr:uncharacterized protein ARMOST_12531 [Armillaria ostoyae]
MQARHLTDPLPPINVPFCSDVPSRSDVPLESEEPIHSLVNEFEHFWERGIPTTTEDQTTPQDSDDRLPSPSISDFNPSDQPHLPLDYIHTEYHSSSSQEPREEPFEAYSVHEHSAEENIPFDPMPWHPYRSLVDFELSEAILEAALNEGDTDALLKNITKKGGELPEFRNHRELIALWDKSAHHRTPLQKSTFTVPLRGEDYHFDVFHRDLWSWTLDILQDPLLAPHLIWDAQKLFRCKGGTSERFYTEPWTGNIFWEVQSALPVDGKPICYIIYADKTRLSSFGTVQGYPVIVRLGNLPVHIRNGQGVGGGRVIGWLPIVADESKHCNKSYYADFKRAVWHKAFECILSCIEDKSKMGAWVQPPGSDATPWHIFPTIMILSADYKEQLRTSAWSQDLYNEASKLSSASSRNDLLQPYGLRFVKNVFWSIEHCDVHQALSFDRLHAFHNGLFGDHLCKEVIQRIEKLGFGQQADDLLANFPSWKDLYHFKQGFMNVTFTDGRKYKALSKQLIFIAHNILTPKSDPIGYILLQALRAYMELDMYAGLSLHTSSTLQAGRTKQSIFTALIKKYDEAVREEYEAARQAALEADKEPSKKLLKNWDFPKIHLLKHLFDDIEAKGVTLNYNTKPNESMHGSFKESYQRRTNFKDIAKQILRADQWYSATSFIRQQINLHDRQLEASQARVAEAEAEVEVEEHDASLADEEEAATVQLDYALAASVHGHRGKGGGKLSIAEVEDQATENRDYRGFRACLSKHMTEHFEKCPEELPLVNGATAAFEGFSSEDLEVLLQIVRYGMLKSYYTSLADWRPTTDILRCSPSFNHCPHYDFVLAQTAARPLFAQLVMIFECNEDTVSKKIETWDCIASKPNQAAPLV